MPEDCAGRGTTARSWGFRRPAPAASRPRPLAASQRSLVPVYVVFLLSGFAALLYQVVWQRSLFAIYGINLESVTVIVTAFMLGLGAGSLVGGRLSADPSRPVLRWFAGIEAGIGLFGIVSLAVFRRVGELTLGLPAWGTALVTLLLVLGPTVLMGSTLPLLTAHLVRRFGNVGRSVGVLYFVNTLGSALAAFAAPLALLPSLGQARTVWAAAGLNLLAAGVVTALHLHEATRRRTEAA